MKLIGFPLLDNSGYGIAAEFNSMEPTINGLDIFFLLDTGCTVTTLSYNDFIRTGLDFETLEKVNEPVSTANGDIPVRKISSCYLLFYKNSSILAEKLMNVDVMPYQKNTNIYSTLGLDFLKRYSIKFEENYVVLEKQ